MKTLILFVSIILIVSVAGAQAKEDSLQLAQRKHNIEVLIQEDVRWRLKAIADLRYGVTGLDSTRPITERQMIQNVMRQSRIDGLLWLYARYEKECWNDSTQTIETIPYFRPVHDDTVYYDGKVWTVPSDWGINDLVYRPPQYRTVWTHRQPTFEGFREWIQKKIQERDE